MKLSRISVGALALIVMASCGSKTATTDGKAAAHEYPTMVLNEEDALLESVYPVTIKGQEDIEIRPRIDGFIDAIYVDEGSIVRKGQSLFKINSPQADQALSSAKAAVNSMLSQENTAKLNVDRIRPLAEKGIVSQVQLQTVENTYQSVLASSAQAKATLKQAQATMNWTNVASPVDGIVGTISFRQGSLVNSTNVLTMVSNTKNVYAYFSLNEKSLMSFLRDTKGNTQAEKIKNIPPITLFLADGSEYPQKGKLETIGGVVNSNTGAINFRADFPNKENLLRSGTTGKVSVPLTLNGVFIIPQKATFAQQDKILVYKVQGDTIVSQKTIEVRPTPDGQSYAVTSGLMKGDKIVIDGLATLQNGQKIKVTK